MTTIQAGTTARFLAITAASVITLGLAACGADTTTGAEPASPAETLSSSSETGLSSEDLSSVTTPPAAPEPSSPASPETPAPAEPEPSSSAEPPSPESSETPGTSSTPDTSTPDEQNAPEVPPEVANAFEAAVSYLQFQPFSRAGLIHQLSSPAGNGYDKHVATEAVDMLDANWNEQAVKAAKNYLDLMSFSRSGLIHQLESDAGDQFTHEQAVYGVEHAYGPSTGTGGENSGGSGAEVANAARAAENYLQFQAFSKEGLIHQLSSDAGDGYSKKVAREAVGMLEVNWNEQAVKAAKNYLDLMSFSRSGLIHQLESDAGDQFTHAQAVYGVEHAYGQ